MTKIPQYDGKKN